MNAIPTTSIGRARAVLVFGAGEAATAAVSAVVARVRRGAGRDRLLFTGPAVYEQKLISHLRQTVLPVVDQIVQRLTAHRRRATRLKTFEVSTVNLGAASTAEVGLSISGYSADVPVLLSLLSAVLRIPLPQDVVTTGHVASSGGDIRFVASIPAKLAAAIQDPSVSRFVFPALDADASLQGLSPAERDRLKAAINEAKGGIRMAAVSDVAQLIRQVVPEESVVLSSLRGSFFESEGRSESSATPIEHAVSFLAADNDERFWRVLERRLLAGNSEATQELLLARSRYHVRPPEVPRQPRPEAIPAGPIVATRNETDEKSLPAVTKGRVCSAYADSRGRTTTRMCNASWIPPSARSPEGPANRWPLPKRLRRRWTMPR